ncbi:MAG: hypothetical protein IPM07_11135 [Anaerolineales bacterium]|nr:hypothetical protein [Anaerolineales bacterium]
MKIIKAFAGSTWKPIINSLAPVGIVKSSPYRGVCAEMRRYEDGKRNRPAQNKADRHPTDGRQCAHSLVPI